VTEQCDLAASHMEDAMIILDDQTAANGEISDEVAAPTISGPGYFSEPLLLRWMLLFRQKELKWPGARDQVIWDRDRAGRWLIIDNAGWKEVAACLTSGTRGLERLKGRSLNQLRQMHGVSHQLEKEQVIQWFRFYAEKEGRWPNHTDECVWEKDKRERWIALPNRTWLGISVCVACGLKGVERVSLNQFRRRFLEAQIPDLRGQLDHVASGMVGDLPRAAVLELLSLEGPPRRRSARRGATPAALEPPVGVSDSSGERGGLKGTRMVPGHRPGRAKRRIPREAPAKRVLSRELLIHWIQEFKEKVGQWPLSSHGTIWVRKEGQWTVVPDENWRTVDYALRHGRRGLAGLIRMSLREFREREDLSDELSEEQLTVWVRTFHEKEGRWPTRTDAAVWQADAHGRYLRVEGEHWSAIDSALYHGRRGLSALRGTTLSQFRRARGLSRALTEAQIVNWMRLFRGKEGRWPSQSDNGVWGVGPDGIAWVQVPRESWAGIESALRAGGRGLAHLAGLSIALLRKKHQLIDPAQQLTEERIVAWIRQYHEKEGVWPRARDRTVWDKDADGRWIAVENLDWNKINDALTYGLRGLDAARSTTLRRLKDKYGLHEGGTEALTVSRIERWVALFHKKTGKWPSCGSGAVWECDESTGQWTQVAGYTWGAIDKALRYGRYGLGSVGCRGLGQFKARYGLCDAELTEERILGWIRLFHEKEGRWPSCDDRPVWERDAEKGWVVVPGKRWGTLDAALRSGAFSLTGGSSLQKLRAAHGLVSGDKLPLSAEVLIRWIGIFQRKEGRCPTGKDTCVWEEDSAGAFILLKNESWKAIDSAIYLGLRGLKGLRGLTLHTFKQKHGLGDCRTLTEEQLVAWIRKFRERQGKWPSDSDTTVWDQDERGEWFIVPGESWGALDSTLGKGTRGLAHLKGQSLSKLRRRHGLHEDRSEEQIVRWIRLFHEKEGRWPSQYDLAVWDRTDLGEWVLVANESWKRLDTIIRLGCRGMKGLKGSSLPALRRRHGLTDDFTESQIRGWVRLFREKEGRWPSNSDRTIWDKDDQGRWSVVQGENWRIVDAAFRLGLRGLKGFRGSSLARFRRACGLTDGTSPMHLPRTPRLGRGVQRTTEGVAKGAAQRLLQRQRAAS
jgi:hypothetical protein